MAMMAEALDGCWYVVRDGDARALGIYTRHYSAQKARGPYRIVPIGNRARFVGSGEKLLLLSADCTAIFAWRKLRYRKDGQTGVECMAFRKEGPGLASQMIEEAVTYAWTRWPGERLFTFIDPRKIASPNPGYCFKQAGFTYCGTSRKRQLHVLERWPDG